jgi:hypothetical protein
LIHLKFKNSGIQTAGSISFMASALVCISLVTPFQVQKYDKLYKIAQSNSRKRLSGNVYILGNLYSYPVAIFCAAKLIEVLGSDAYYERIDQFSHMGLFSAKRGDTIIIFEKKNGYNEKLSRELRSCGLEVLRMEPPATDPLGQIIFFIFVSELISLYNAKIKKKQDCYFVEAKKLRDASSSMIY